MVDLKSVFAESYCFSVSIGKGLTGCTCWF